MKKKVLYKQQFLNMVEHEVRQLKIHAKPKELANLDIKDLSPRYTTHCIYGLLTGFCHSQRAFELMNKSSIGLWDFDTDDNNYTHILIESPTFSKVSRFLTYGFSDKRSRLLNCLTPLEGYIGLKGAKNKQIIDFLQDKTKTLSL